MGNRSFFSRCDAARGGGGAIDPSFQDVMQLEGVGGWGVGGNFIAKEVLCCFLIIASLRSLQIDEQPGRVLASRQSEKKVVVHY